MRAHINLLIHILLLPMRCNVFVNTCISYVFFLKTHGDAHMHASTIYSEIPILCGFIVSAILNVALVAVVAVFAVCYLLYVLLF